MTAIPIVLASSSPRRQWILRQIGIPFIVMPSRVDEEVGLQEKPLELVRSVAVEKARDVARRLVEGIVVGADTVVVCGEGVLGKPRDQEDAAAMLASLSGRAHQVHTGLAVLDVASGRELVEVETTVVHFRRITRSEIDRYVLTGEPLDKAGAYGIQGMGALFVDRIEGCFYNVVGLPVARLYAMLREFGLMRGE
jgi:septum formation protein